jgi:hypothetical protein
MNAVHLDICPAVRTSTVAGIEALFDPHVHLVVWERTAELAAACATHWPATTGRMMRTIRVDRLDPANVAATLSLPATAPVTADLLMLCDLFATLTGTDTLGIRVDITDRASCPRMHADHVTLRMMTTYRGPGTEWLQDGETEQASAGDVLLAKGDLWPGLRSGPCVHRSPEPRHGETRVLVTLDAL